MQTPEPRRDDATDAVIPPAPDEPVPVTEDDIVASPDAAAVVSQTIRVAVGAVVIATATVAEGVRRTLPAPTPTDEDAPPQTDALALLTGAALGATVAAGDAVANAAGDLVRTVRPVASWWLAVLPLGSGPARLREGLEGLDARWREARPGTEAAASALARELVPEIVDAVLDQLDLTWAVAERVDLDALVSRVDLDAVAERIDVDRVIARVDLDKVAAGIDVDAVVARVDLDRIVSRIDVNEVAAKIDLQAVIDRIDVAGIAAGVIDELDIAGLIRESTEAVTTESVRGIRVQSANADRYIERVAAKVLRRGAETPEPTGDEHPPA